MSTMLVIAAHPDDEVLGCGGILALEGGKGSETHVLFMTDGGAGRYEPAQCAQLERDAREANRLLGVTALHFEAFPNQRLETVPLGELISCIERHIEAIRPTAVYAHHRHDLNRDHQLLAEATLVACRPLPGQRVRDLYAYNVPSSTEWGNPDAGHFSPNVVVDIGGAVETKIAAMACYRSECREYPHPRSPEGLRFHARYWGVTVGIEHGEPFRLIRSLR